MIKVLRSLLYWKIYENFGFSLGFAGSLCSGRAAARGAADLAAGA